MKNNYIAADIYSNFFRTACRIRREARKRGSIFDAFTFRRIVQVWSEATAAPPVHTPSRLELPATRGRKIIIRPERITYAEDPTAAEFRAMMVHALTFWGGRAVLPDTKSLSHETRLKFHAYAEVYGVELQDMLQRDYPINRCHIFDLCDEIRAIHADAPPPRPSQEERDFVHFMKNLQSFRLAG